MQMLYKYNVLGQKRNFEHICYFLDTPSIIVTGISSLTISCIAFCCVWSSFASNVPGEKAFKDFQQRWTMSVTEFGFENVKLE